MKYTVCEECNKIAEKEQCFFNWGKFFCSIGCILKWESKREHAKC